MLSPRRHARGSRSPPTHPSLLGAPSTPRSAAATRTPADIEAELRRGALSAASLSKIRSRVRFPDLAEYTAKNTPSPPQRSRPAGAPARARGAAEEENAVDDAADDDDSFVPSHLSRKLLEAHEEVDEVPELAAVWSWLELLRETRGVPNRPENVDLRNCVAFLDVMRLVLPQREEAVGEVEDAFVVPPPKRPLERNGTAARENFDVLCEALTKYPWIDPENQQRVKPIDFKTVKDRRGLAGFVLLAAVTSRESSRFVDEIELLDDDSKEALDFLAGSAMDRLGFSQGATVRASENEENESSDSVGDTIEGDTESDERVPKSSQANSEEEVGAEPEREMRDFRQHELSRSEPPVDAASSCVGSTTLSDRSSASSDRPSVESLLDEMARLRDALSESQREALQWEARCCELERVSEQLCAEADSLRARLASQRSSPDRSPRGRDNKENRNSEDRRQIVLLRKKVMDAEKRAAGLEKQLLSVQTSPGGTTHANRRRSRWS